ncbi:biopolymer transporter ExbD [bacterium]|nr:biopolymer transporter ExbD [bacterium]
MGLSTKRESKPIAEINMTPLVDVSLVLVIIFMVSAPMIAQQGILVNSQKKEVGDKPEQTREAVVETIYIKIAADYIELNGKKTGIKVLPFKLKHILISNPDEMVYINSEGQVQYGRVVSVLDIARQSGARKLALLNDKEGLLERTLIFNKKRR